MKPTYITTPIYYVNDSPHIGHAYTTIAADVLARFMRLSGRETYFLTGTDEHGQKVDKAAKAKGVSPQALCDEVSQRFRALVNPCDGSEAGLGSPASYEPGEADTHCVDSNPHDGKQVNLLNISNDDFIRTTEERHKKAAQELWRRMEANGWIYKATYGGWYAVRDEAYYQEGELIEKNGKQVAPTGAEVEWVEEESYFFKLSAFQEKLLAFYDANPEFIVPKARFNEVCSFVKGGLKDLSISRTTFDWGIAVPEQGQSTSKHIMYVWVDALTNYLTAIGFPDTGENFQKFWGTKDEPRAIHIVGKDIVRFHAVYWPAFLMAADLPCPKQIVAHGWWTIEGEKMSKSLGNVISPQELVGEYGLDAVRYFMLRAMPFGNDGDFSKDRVAELVNADLANNIGNLAQRVLKMIQKNCGGVVPAAELNGNDQHLLTVVEYALKNAETQVELRQLHGAAEALVEASNWANDYITEQQPWSLSKTDENRMSTVLYVLVESIRKIAILLQPFCPSSAAKMLVQLGYDERRAADGIPFTELQATYALKPGTPLPEPQGVFPRLEVKKANG